MVKKRDKDLLMEPMPSFQPGLLASDEDAKDLIASRVKLEFQKLDLLIERYGLPPKDYAGLALALACDYEPGFKTAVKQGRPVKWDVIAQGHLYVEVQRRMDEFGLDETRAIVAVASLPHWVDFLDTIDSLNVFPNAAEALGKAYSKAKKDKLSKVLWKAFCLHKLEDTIPEWDALVANDLDQSKSPPEKK